MGGLSNQAPSRVDALAPDQRLSLVRITGLGRGSNSCRGPPGAGHWTGGGPPKGQRRPPRRPGGRSPAEQRHRLEACPGSRPRCGPVQYCTLSRTTLSWIDDWWGRSWFTQPATAGGWMRTRPVAGWACSVRVGWAGVAPPLPSGRGSSCCAESHNKGHGKKCLKICARG